MPKALIAKMKAGYAGSSLSEEEINHRIYGHLNKIGAMHGSKETEKGAEMDAKVTADHPSKADHKAMKRARSLARAAKYKLQSRSGSYS